MLPYRAIRSNENEPTERVKGRESDRLHTLVFEVRHLDSL